MKLRITTPLDIVIDQDDVMSLRAEDASGSFGIRPGHADFLTSLAVSVVAWQGADGIRHFCAVRRGVLTVSAGREVAVATREAVAGDDLATLDQIILTRFQEAIETERTERVQSTRLQLDAIRRMVSHLQPGRRNPGLSS